MSNLAIYERVRTDIATYKIENAKLVFDYEDPVGNKNARSHIAKLRKVNAEIERVRKAEKAVYLEGGQQVDREAKELSVPLAEMINVHLEPIRAIEARKDAADQAIIDAENAAMKLEADEHEAHLMNREIVLAAAEGVIRAKQAAVAAQEAEKARLDREAYMVKQAAEKATRDAEAKAELERKAALIEKERLAQIEAARVADVKHRNSIEIHLYQQILDLVIENTPKGEIAFAITEAIKEDRIDNLSINY